MEGPEVEKRDVRRPMNAFLIFCKRHRSIVREKNPDLDNRSVTRILGDLWANLKDEEKTVYTDLAKQYKDAFMKANPDYKWHNPEKSLNSTKSSLEKTFRSEINILPEGSITPGKLADPSNMGGLSLLLMAGEQSNRESMGYRRPRTYSEGATPETTALYHVPRQPVLSSHPHTDHITSLPHDDNMIAIHDVAKQHTINSQDDVQNKNISNNFIKEGTVQLMTSKAFDIVTKPLLYQAVAAPKVCQKTLLSETLKSTTDKNIYSEILCDNVGTPENTDKLNASYLESMEKNKFTSVHGKENFTKLEVKEGKPCSEEAPLITCGKMVVNNIIDKLYSDEISVDALKTANETQSVVGGEENSDNSFNDDKHDSFNEKNNADRSQLLVDQDESNNNSKAFDEADGMADVKSSRKRHISQSSSMGNDSVEENEELQPLRKSRRRNKGQRYQMLINDGIIQPSKERMAALQKHSPKHEGPEEEIVPEQSCNFYILPETVGRRFRKRTTSESAKDRFMPLDDVKRYKTGDFDLEAQIATLPACAVENMGRKRGFARQRHNSESMHTHRKPSDIDHHTPQVRPVGLYEGERTVSLPPHIRIPSPEQKSSEPIVGSRKRKARKHSITHLLPAPPAVIQSTEMSKHKGIETKAKSEAAAETKCETKPNIDTKPNFTDIQISGSEQGVAVSSVTMVTNSVAGSEVKCEQKCDSVKIESVMDKQSDEVKGEDKPDNEEKIPKYSDKLTNNIESTADKVVADNLTNPMESSADKVVADKLTNIESTADKVVADKLTNPVESLADKVVADKLTNPVESSADKVVADKLTNPIETSADKVLELEHETTKAEKTELMVAGT